MKANNSYNIQLGIDNAKFLCSLGIPHRLLISSGSARIEPEGGKPMVFSSGEIAKKHLWFLRYTKNAVQNSGAYIENEHRLKQLNASSVEYILDGGRHPGTYEGVTEIDLNGAYWSAAHQLGYISDSVYMRGIERDESGELKVPKGVRLIALGALARKRTIREFTPDSGYEYIGLDYDAHLGGVFFDCAKLIGDVMLKCVAAVNQSGIDTNPFLFYWFDALFVRRELAPLVSKFFALHNFGSKEIELKRIVIEHGRNGRVATAYTESGKQKPYHLSMDFRCKIAFDEFIAEIKNNH